MPLAADAVSRLVAGQQEHFAGAHHHGAGAHPLGVFIGDVDHIVGAALAAVAAFTQHADHGVRHTAQRDGLAQRVPPKGRLRQIVADDADILIADPRRCS